MPKEEHRIFEFGSFRLDPAAAALTADGLPVQLKPKAFDLLVLLVGEPNRLFTKDELMERLWPDTFVEEANLTQTIYELRRALGESARELHFIQNVPKRGYRFSGSPRVHLARAGEGDHSLGLRSIAVLPFRSLASEARDEALELGIAETLATAISRLGKFIVRPVSAVIHFAAGENDPIAAGKHLGVDAILYGTVQHASGDRLRISVRFDRTDGSPAIWAGTFDERADDLFDLQDSLLEKVLGSLSLKLADTGTERRRDRRAADAETHKLFLKCRYHWHKWTPENWRLSIEYGRQVIERDPEHAEAHAWTAASFCTLGIFGVLPPAEAFGKAREFVVRSRELDAATSKAHEVLAAIKLFHDWDWPSLPGILRQALDLDPNNSTAQNLKALFEATEGRFDEAMASIDRALEIDPLSLVSNTDKGFLLLYAGRFDEALDQLERTLELDPYFAHAHYGLGFANSALGRHVEAFENMKNGAQIEGIAADDSAEVGFAAARKGDTEKALKIAERFEAKASSGYHDPYRTALIFSGLDERERTFECLRQAVGNRSRELIYLNCHPAFAWLRSESEFSGLLGEIGLDPERAGY